jgi:hypothetical protein
VAQRALLEQQEQQGSQALPDQQAQQEQQAQLVPLEQQVLIPL